jgi:hypothetical protein
MATNGRTRSGQATRTTGANRSTVTDAVEARSTSHRTQSDDAVERDPGERGAFDPDDHPDAEAVADRIRERGERVRQRELADALDRLDAAEELSASQREMVARLSARLADALVEQWASTVAEERVDPGVARDLLDP